MHLQKVRHSSFHSQWLRSPAKLRSENTNSWKTLQRRQLAWHRNPSFLEFFFCFFFAKKTLQGVWNKEFFWRYHQISNHILVFKCSFLHVFNISRNAAFLFYFSTRSIFYLKSLHPLKLPRFFFLRPSKLVDFREPPWMMNFHKKS